MSKKYFEEVDILKGIAIAMVILGHAVIRYPVNLHEVGWTKAIYDWVETMHMPLFFLVSGFCFSYQGNYAEFIVKKVKRILIPYIAFNLIDCVPRAALSFLVNRPKSIGESIYSIIFLGGEYWFLYVLFFIFVIFPFISCFVKKTKAKWILVLVCAALKFVPDLPEYFLIYRLVYHLFYFVVGFAMKDVFSVSRTSEWIKVHKPVSIVWLLLICICQIFLIPLYVTDYNQILGIFLAGIGIIFCYLLTVLVKERHIRNLFCEFGKYSLQLYLLNGFMLVFSRTLVVNVVGITNPMVILSVNMFFDLFVSYLIIKYVIARTKVLSKISGII